MHYYKEYQLDQLGISSPKEADELQRDLDIRFDQFSYSDREDWVQQNAYLDAYAHTRTVSDAANEAGVTISTAQHWKYLNTLGFKHRLEEAELRFSDSIQVIALERVKEPNAPVALLITFLRAYIPEKFSTNGHVCDTSKDEDLLYRYSQGALREMEAGHPTLRAIADGTYQHPKAASDANPPVMEESLPRTGYGGWSEGNNPSTENPHSSRPRRRVASPVMEESWGEDNDPSHDDGPPSFPDDDIQPFDPDEVAYFELPPNDAEDSHLSPHGGKTKRDSHISPHGGETKRGGSSAPSTPSAVNPPDPSHDDGPPSFPDDDIQPIDPDEVAYFNLPPNERKNTPHPSMPSAESPPTPSPVLGEGWGEGDDPSHDEPNTFPVKRF